MAISVEKKKIKKIKVIQTSVNRPQKLVTMSVALPIAKVPVSISQQVDFYLRFARSLNGFKDSASR